jgi:hypothetical protein
MVFPKVNEEKVLERSYFIFLNKGEIPQMFDGPAVTNLGQMRKRLFLYLTLNW